MSVSITEVTDRKQLKAFIDFPNRLYRGNPYFVPALNFDEEATLRKDRNPAFDHCRARYWLACKNGRTVGRIAAIVSHAYIEKWKNPYMRFGWIDFEEDEEIVNALLSQVENWAKELGMKAVHGPLGFTDLDHEGMLIEGFEELGTMATIYNYQYYPALLEKFGYAKDADWVQFKITMPTSMPDKLVKMASVVQRRLGLSLVPLRSSRDILPYAADIFGLINSSYSDLYGVVPLNERQVKYYTKQYFSFIRPDFVSLVVDREGKLAAFGVTMPSLSLALQKANGRLFPFGFFHLWKAMKRNTLGDLYLVAIRKDLQGKGVNAMFMHELTKTFIENGIEYAEANPQLEDNLPVQSLWKHYEARQHKRRRCYIKHLQ
jgi:GNAT superfamily N-acetyltransferase